MSGPPQSEAGRLEEESLRERLADALADRLDVPMSVLGALFLGIVLTESLAPPGPPWSRVLGLAGSAIWVVFVGEFAVRLWISPSPSRFLRRNWWQVLFLVLPFLRFVRALRVVRSLRLARIARAGRVLASGIRSTRSAGRVLTGRLATLTVVHAVVVLVGAVLLHEFTDVPTFGDALFLSARAAVNGQALGDEGTVARIIEVCLATYAVVVFATLAGTLGAFLVERRRAEAPESDTASKIA